MSRSNFAWAFPVLPRGQRAALSALYAFCRAVDDLVDETADPASAREGIRRWGETLDRFPNPSVFDPSTAHDLAAACQQFPIRLDDLRWILRGVSADLEKRRYETWEELLDYCDGVASSVGFASMAIFGADREKTSAYTFATGRALQITNILRDVGSDGARGRIYLPAEDLRRFGVREGGLLRGLYDERFAELMRFEARRTERLYVEAEAALSPAERRAFPAAEIMRKTYRILLRRIEEKRFNVFPGKIGVPRARKLSVVLSVSLSRWFGI